ncbi:olfactory receptor 1020-like [Rhinatrema bivittatum]|uniref:olfactory receptor 1020-like n=1 Tax=Rhinatrema bivittatum TaxID=194408 RepID=UPI00112E488A|nr:olfactory receptor 1020-like [Rhinatrema bivittatum]
MTISDSLVTEFIFLGLTDVPEIQILLFLLFLLIYIITLLGNIGIIMITRITPHLQTPMYFFLSNLSFIDLCYSSTITPKLLENLLVEVKSISFIGCIVQLYVFASMATIESLLLSVMAYDRYVAICNPLLYTVTITKRICIQLVCAAFLGGFLQSAIQTGFTFRLSYCGSNEIKHFYCDIPPLLKLSCSDTLINEIVIFICGSFTSLGCLLVILMSYAYIISSILRIHSTEGRCKIFSTCGSHLLVVILFYATILFTYFRPTSTYSLSRDRVVSVFYTVVIPMLNPLIYSLRNQEVKDSMRTVIKRKICSHYCQ